MTEELIKTEEQTKEEKVQEFERDWFLQTLVNMTNNSTSTGLIGITLLTHGFLVSGDLVSGREYFKGFAEDFAGAFGDEHSKTAKTIKETFISYGQASV